MNDRNLLLSTEAVITKIIRWFVILSAASAAAMMVIAFVDVVGSKFFNWSLKGAAEFIEELNVLLVFLAIGYVELERGHIRIAVLEKFMFKGLLYIFKLFRYLIGMLVIGILSWRTLIFAKKMLATGVVKNSPIDFPIWPSAMVVFLGFAFLTIAFILLLGKAIITESKW